MTRKKSFITVTDQFCGAGGSSVGATGAGAELRLALNHWKLAIETHNTNFPDADHDCTDISACDPRRYPSTDILITSPECTNHSLAKGRARKYQKQLSLFGKVVLDPAEERSRATMWDVPRFAEYHGYRVIIVENVVEARMWAMWDAWLHAMELLGYQHKCVYLNSMFAHPTPQSRDRMYVVFWRKGQRAPNLDIRPSANCPKCGDVNAVQSWKQGRSAGRYRKQYVYCCPNCAAVVEPYYHAAFNAIDWTLPAPRIGDRVRPLKPATVRRIEIGLKRFGVDPHLLAMMDSTSENWSLGLNEPFKTMVASASQHWLVKPQVVDLGWTHASNARSTDIDNPMPTQTTRATQALMMPPFIVSQYNRLSGIGAAVRSVDEPMPTQPAMAVHKLVVPPFLMSYYGTNAGSEVTEPVPALTTRDRHAVVVPPFIVNMQANNLPTAMHEPLQTLLTGSHRYLATPTESVKVEDCGFRMLEPHECQAAMAFPNDYQVLGGKRDRIKQLGNAVTPPAMGILMQRCMESLR